MLTSPVWQRIFTQAMLDSSLNSSRTRKTTNTARHSQLDKHRLYPLRSIRIGLWSIVMKMASLNVTLGQSVISETAPRPDRRDTLGRRELDSSQFSWPLGRSISNLDISLSASCIERVIPVWAWCNRFGRSRKRNYQRSQTRIHKIKR